MYETVKQYIWWNTIINCQNILHFITVFLQWRLLQMVHQCWMSSFYQSGLCHLPSPIICLRGRVCPNLFVSIRTGSFQKTSGSGRAWAVNFGLGTGLGCKLRARAGLGLLQNKPEPAGRPPNPGPFGLGLLAYLVKARARPRPSLHQL
jgi:hypothetical protein